jgi:drug/metabolite transporter (DMT)-like permease
MTDLAAGARSAIAKNPDRVGFAAITAFVVLTAFRDIYLWSIFRSFSPLHVATLSFGLCGLVFLPVALTRHRGDLRRLMQAPHEAVLMNVACAVSWIAYFYALRTLEPALAQMLCTGVGPIAADLAEWRGSSRARGSRTELALHLGIVVSLVLAVQLLFGRPSADAAHAGGTLFGVVMALVSGVTLAIYRISCSRLNRRGVAPVTILAVRSPIVAVAAAALAWSTGDTALGDWTSGSLALVSAACVALIVFPIYVNQVGVALASPVTAGVASALQPTLIFALQAALRPGGGVHDAFQAPAMAVSILVYSAFAIASSVIRSQRSSDVPLPSVRLATAASR